MHGWILVVYMICTDSGECHDQVLRFKHVYDVQKDCFFSADHLKLDGLTEERTRELTRIYRLVGTCEIAEPELQEKR